MRPVRRSARCSRSSSAIRHQVGRQRGRPPVGDRTHRGDALRPSRALQRPGLPVRHPDRPGADVVAGGRPRLAAARVLPGRARRPDPTGHAHRPEHAARRMTADVPPGTPRRATRIWLARHGETEWARLLRHTSHTDVPLTATGEREAVALGDRLRDQPFGLVLVEPDVPGDRDGAARRPRRRRPRRRRPPRVGLRRARGPRDRADPRPLPGLDDLARAVARRRDRRRRHPARRSGRSPGAPRPTSPGTAC